MASDTQEHEKSVMGIHSDLMNLNSVSQMKYLFAGDIHGNVSFLDDAIRYAERHNCRFVQTGDLVDSHDPLTGPEQQLQVLDLVCSRHGSSDIYLAGNHDLSYLWDHLRCSSYQESHAEAFRDRLSTIPFQYFLMVDDLLVTHAGLSLRFLKDQSRVYGFSLPDSPQETASWLQAWLREHTASPWSDLFQPGAARGGMMPTGGITWCDYFEEFEPVPSIHQIFGHSVTSWAGGLRGILEHPPANSASGRNFAIDNVSYGRRETLLYDDRDRSFRIITHRELQGPARRPAAFPEPEIRLS